MAQGREEDKLSTLLVEIKMEDNLSDEARKARAEVKKLRDGVDELLGEVAKGDAEFSALKSELEQIRDPILRAEAAQKLLNRQYNRQLGFLDKLQDRHKAFMIDLKSQGAMGNVAAMGIQAAGAAVVALGAAVTAFAVDSMKTYIESNAETRIATDELSASFKGLQNSMGEALLGPPEEAAEKIGRLSNAMKNLDREVEANSKEINEFVDGAVDVLVGAFEVLTATTALALTPLSLLGDGILNVAGLFLELVGTLGGPLADAFAELGIISDESADSLKEYATAAEKTGEELGDKFLTGDLWDARDAMVDFTGAVVDGTAPLTKFTDEVGDLDTRLIGFEATLERLADMDAVTFLTQLGEAQLGPLADGTEQKKKAKPKRRGGGKKKTDPNLAFADAALEGVAAIEAKKRLEEAIAADDADRGVFFSEEDIAQINKAGEELKKVTAALEGLDEEFEKNFAEGQKAQQVAAFNRQFSDILTSGINDATSAMLDFTSAVISGDIALADMGKTAFGIVGDVFSTLGKGLLAASLGVEGLFSLNPALMVAGGIGLLAAGAVIKGISQGGEAGAKSGVSQGAALLESIGSDFARQEDAATREASTSIYIGPREIRNFVVETVDDAQRRNEFAFTGSL